MFTHAKRIQGLTIRAKDGDIGTVDELYFDDQTWGIRYITVETGNWLSGRKVLISPISIINLNWEAKCLDVALTMQQVKDSPDIDLHRPVSRQHEAQYLGYYGYPYYWDGPYMWGQAYYPTGLAVSSTIAVDELARRVQAQSNDSHLRSNAAVNGYHLEAKDGEIGHVDDFVVDDYTWAIRYIEVATHNWLPGKKVLLSPSWVERVSWEESKVFVAATCEAIRTCPEYDESMPITREYENRLYFHYGHAPYWIEEVKNEAAFASSAR